MVYAVVGLSIAGISLLIWLIVLFRKLTSERRTAEQQLVQAVRERNSARAVAKDNAEAADEARGEAIRLSEQVLALQQTLQKTREKVVEGAPVEVIEKLIDDESKAETI